MAMETLAMLDMAMVLDTEASMERERLRLSLRLMPSSWLLPTPVTMASMAMVLDMAMATLDIPTLVPMAMVLVLAIPTMLLLEPAETTLELPFPANL